MVAFYLTTCNFGRFGAVALGLGLILTYAGFRAAPIVPGAQ